MAVVTTKATVIINADAAPPVANNPLLERSRKRVSVGTVEVAAGDSANSVYIFARVHSGARLSSIKLFNDAQGAGAVADIGLHQPASDGGAAVDANLFGTAVDMNSARTTSPLDVRFETLNIDGIEKAIWELLGLASDPGLNYDLTLTLTTAGGAGATFSIELDHTDGS